MWGIWFGAVIGHGAMVTPPSRNAIDRDARNVSHITWAWCQNVTGAPCNNGQSGKFCLEIGHALAGGGACALDFSANHLWIGRLIRTVSHSSVLVLAGMLHWLP